MTRHKWFKLDAETWLADPKLNMASWGAKGLWIHIICLCHISERYGYLVINRSKSGQNNAKNMSNECQIDVKSMSNLCQINVKRMLKLGRKDAKYLQELIDLNIIKQDNEGFFYCHKLLKDKNFGEKQAEFANKRWNKNQDENPMGDPMGDPLPDKNKNKNKIDIREDNKEKIIKKENLLSELLNHDYFKNNEFYELWESFCETKGKKYTTDAKIIQLRTLFEFDINISIQSIKKAISSGWKAIYPENKNIQIVNGKKKEKFLLAHEKSQKSMEELLEECEQAKKEGRKFETGGIWVSTPIEKIGVENNS